MAGHSKWANIKHKKALVDAKKGKLFSKIARDITVCARVGGGDPETNVTLRTLLNKARAANMPSDNIDRAIKKGTGALDDGVQLEEVVYEGYAPGGVMVVVQALTENRNRTAGEVRSVFTKAGANLATSNAVLRSFNRKGVITVDAAMAEEDALLEIVLGAGAEDLAREGDQFEITTAPADFGAVVNALRAGNVPTLSAEITLLPELYTTVSDRAQADSLLGFVENLEDLDDVQNVYTNMDLDDAVVASLQAG
jgi:YebC/PmpR family DNA-binding regulatory protein